MTNITAQALSAALTAFQGIVDNRAAVPILSHVRLRRSAGCLSIHGTDLDTQLIVRLPDDGPALNTTVPLRRLADTLRGASGEVTINAGENGKPSVTAASVTTTMASLAADDMPLMDIAPKANFMVGAGALLEALEFVKAGISTEETRYYLNCVFLQFGLAGTEVVATNAVTTDGHRLFRQAITTAQPVASDDDGVLKKLGEGGVLIPREAVLWMLKNLPSTGDLLIYLDPTGHKMRVVFGQSELTLKLIDGAFPDYQRVLPDVERANIHIDINNANLASQLINRIQRVSVHRDKTILIEPFEGEVRATCSDGEGGESHCILPATTADGDNSSWWLKVNSKYLLDALDRGTLTLLAEAEGKDIPNPVGVHYPNRPDRVGVIMPLRTN